MSNFCNTCGYRVTEHASWCWARKLAMSEQELARIRAENDRLRAAIMRAPHDEYCRMGVWCECWKMAALAGKEQSNG